MRKYTIILEPDPEVGGYTVTVPHYRVALLKEKPLNNALNGHKKRSLVILKALSRMVSLYLRKLSDRR